MKKVLRAFTLTEVLVVMIISGLLTGFVYWTFLTVRGYYSQIVKGQEKGLLLRQAMFQLIKDVEKASVVEIDEGGFKLHFGSRQFKYATIGKYLVRKDFEKADTLFELCEVKYNNLALDTIETKVVVKIVLFHKPNCDSIVIVKDYDATVLSKVDFNSK